VTAINIQRFAETPRTTLEGIAPEFIIWAETVHGWDGAALLEIGQAYGCCGNALDELVAHHRRLEEGGTNCCCCSSGHAPHSTYGGLLAYCDDEYPAYADGDAAKFMQDDQLTAAGLMTKHRGW
jgi:hypothetical protein